MLSCISSIVLSIIGTKQRDTTYRTVCYIRALYLARHVEYILDQIGQLPVNTHSD